MKTASRHARAILCGGVALWAASACGAPVPAAAPHPASAASDGERCIADADVKREHKASEPNRVSVKHVLVRYAGAKRAPDAVTRTREQACLRAEEALAQLKKGTPFADVVASYSDEEGAATREGSIGTIERADVAPPFADAAFELGPREVSEVVETPFGFHVILRVE